MDMYIYNYSLARPSILAVPGPPVVTDIEPSPDSIHLLWEHPVEPRGELLFYNLSWMNVADTSDGGKEKLPANQTSYTITGLRSKSQYNISLMVSSRDIC